MPTIWTPRTGRRFEQAATFTSRKMRLDFWRDAFVGHHLNALRDLPDIKQGRGSASVTIRIGRLIEPIVNEIMREGLLAVLAISDVVFTCHTLQMLRGSGNLRRTLSTFWTISNPHSVPSVKSVAAFGSYCRLSVRLLPCILFSCRIKSPCCPTGRAGFAPLR
jgi:hypothetical protein